MFAPRRQGELRLPLPEAVFAFISPELGRLPTFPAVDRQIHARYAAIATKGDAACLRRRAHRHHVARTDVRDERSGKVSCNRHQLESGLTPVDGVVWRVGNPVGLARWLRARGIEAYVIHATSIAVSREHRRAKTDRLDTELLKRAFIGWLRGEPNHCNMVPIPSLEEEDAKRPNRERESLVGERTRIVNRMKSHLARLGIRDFKPTLRKAPEHLATLRTAEGMQLPPNTLAELRRDMARLRFVMDQITEIEQARLDRIAQRPEEGMHAMVRVLSGVKGIGVETADMLVHEIFSRPLRDRRAVARYAGLTGSPDESGGRRREKGLAKAGNARVRRGMVQIAWRFLVFQKDSALSQWFRFRTENARGTRKTMIVALARKLLIGLWRFTRTGELPEGVGLQASA